MHAASGRGDRPHGSMGARGCDGDTRRGQGGGWRAVAEVLLAPWWRQYLLAANMGYALYHRLNNTYSYEFLELLLSCPQKRLLSEVQLSVLRRCCSSPMMSTINIQATKTDG